MNKMACLVFSACLITGLVITSCSSAGGNYPESANRILALLLKIDHANGDYTVVSPETSTGMGQLENDEDRKNLIANITRNFNKGTSDFTRLATLFCDINSQSQRLTLESSTKDGYFIDYDGKFSQYFDKDGGGWEKLRQENPQARGMTNISLPAYDPQTGYVLVYMGTQYDWLAGAGYMYLYKYTRGKLTEINSYMMWIS